MPDRPATEATPEQVTVRQVHAEFERLLKDRTHMGVRNFLGDAFLEPRTPFQRTRRPVRKWVVALGGIVLIGVVLVYVFHLR